MLIQSKGKPIKSKRKF